MSFVYSSRTKVLCILHSKQNRKERLQKESKHIGLEFKNSPRVTQNKRFLDLTLSLPIYTNR